MWQQTDDVNKRREYEHGGARHTTLPDEGNVNHRTCFLYKSS